MRLYQVTADHMCAGLIVTRGTVVRAAPILGYMHGWHIKKVQRHCNHKYWSLVCIMGAKI